MAGTSDSKCPDDIRMHLQQVLATDARLADQQPGESESDRRWRESARLPAELRAALQTSLTEMRAATPGIDSTAAIKLAATLAGRAALEEGVAALDRVDCYLRAVTGSHSAHVSRDYGLYGKIPTSFAGVYRALLQSKAENDRVKILPTTDPRSKQRFTPIVEAAVADAGNRLATLIGERVTTRAELSRKIEVKEETLNTALTRLAAVREHLYANLPRGKRDAGLRDYGFRQLLGRGAARDEEDEAGEEPLSVPPVAGAFG